MYFALLSSGLPLRYILHMGHFGVENTAGVLLFVLRELGNISNEGCKHTKQAHSQKHHKTRQTVNTLSTTELQRCWVFRKLEIT